MPAGLPYNHIVTQDGFAELPDNLRHKFKYQLASLNSGTPGTAFITLNQPTATSRVNTVQSVWTCKASAQHKHKP
ncbi:MAG: hypothetical protein K6L73_13110 [Cellvibrionaceae bacterium]